MSIEMTPPPNGAAGAAQDADRRILIPVGIPPHPNDRRAAAILKELESDSELVAARQELDAGRLSPDGYQAKLIERFKARAVGESVGT